MAKVLCILCSKVVADMGIEESMAYILWLRREGTVPVCFDCSDRAIGNLYVRLEPEIKAQSELATRVRAEDVF